MDKVLLKIEGLSKSFGENVVLKDINLEVKPGEIVGLVGENGAGKSTFLKILAGDIEPNKGEVFITPGERLAVLKQDHFMFDDFDAIKTVLYGHKRLYDIMEEKDALYMKPDFNDDDGLRVSELEGEFAELDGWNAESNAQKLLNGLGITNEFH